MRFFKKRRSIYGKRPSIHEEDPLSAVANLFDVAMVFAVGLMVSMVSAYHLKDIVFSDTDVTILKNPNQPGKMEIISKKGKKIKVKKMTKEMAQGEGLRLGIAYQLKNGQVVYMPEGGKEGE